MKSGNEPDYLYDLDDRDVNMILGSVLVATVLGIAFLIHKVDETEKWEKSAIPITYRCRQNQSVYVLDLKREYPDESTKWYTTNREYSTLHSCENDGDYIVETGEWD